MKALPKLTVLLLLLFYFQSGFSLTVGDLRVQNMKNPEGIDDIPQFCWKLFSTERSVVQTTYQVIVSSDENGGQEIWNSGVVQSEQSVHVPAQGIMLKPSTRYYWHVTVSDNKGHQATSTETSYFDTGLLTSGWGQAKWIKASDGDGTAADTVKNYTVETKFTIERTSAGICFAQQNANDFYMWQFNTEGSFPRFRPHRWTNGNPSCLANIDLTGKVDLKNGQQYQLKIVVTQNGGHAATYLNNVLIDERDGNFAFGKVGFREDHGEIDPSGEIALFDDVKVADDKGKDLFTDDFTSTKKFTSGDLVNGQLRVVGSTTQTIYSWQSSNSFVHYDVEGDITLLNSAAAIVFAGTAGNTYHMWQLNCQDHDTPAIRRHVYINGQVSVSDATFTQFTKADLLQHPHHMKIEVNGSTINTYIDNILVDSYQDNSGTAVMGKIGMRVDANNKESAYFDNLKIVSYQTDGTSQVVFSEDFENASQNNFISATVVPFNNSQVCLMSSVAGEKRLMQSSFDGVPMFKKTITLAKTLKTAKLYTSALGVYDMFINGKRVGHQQPDGSVVYEELKPGWSDYRHRVFYSSHDVTTLLSAGTNVIGAVVTSGWYSGGIAHGMYGSDKDLGLIAKLVLTYDDGTEDVIVTDGSWEVSRNGGLQFSEIYNGEVYDARKTVDWTNPDSETMSWKPVAINTLYRGKIECFKGPYVQVLKNLIQPPKTATVYLGSKPDGSDWGMVNVIKTQSGTSTVLLKKGETVVFDFGQNVVGWWDFTVKGNSGTRLHMQCSEMLNDDGKKSRGNDGPGGSLYLVNLRSARAEIYYTLRGDQAGENWHPSTTFYGFRYCAITATEDVEISQIKAVPISSSTEETGDIQTGSSIINQLYSNIVWGQRGNLLSIPTDCPQRDERQGWTADTQVFSTTGMFNANTESFYRKWMTDMRDGQRPDGAFPDTAPAGYAGYGGAAWSDAGILVPWNVYKMYGNKEILKENFDAMEKYMTWLSLQTGDGQYQGASTTYGDWLSFVQTDSRYVSMAYYAYDAQLMVKMAQALSTSETDAFAQKAKDYQLLFNQIRTAFINRYFYDGTPHQNSQTALLMALRYRLVTDSAQVVNLTKRLETNIKYNGNRLNTGFLGTAIINPTLSQFGLNNTAYNLLFQRSNPSWLYPIDQGATTMWERWNSYTKDKGFNDPGMNSFNHYAYGAIGEWMYRYMSGIEFDEEQPGFKHFILQPKPDTRDVIPAQQEKLTQVKASYLSNYGQIESNWNITDNNQLSYTCVVPANSTATLYLPTDSATADGFKYKKNGMDLEGIEYVGYENQQVILNLGSGSYNFSVQSPTSVILPSYNHESLVYPNPTKD